MATTSEAQAAGLYLSFELNETEYGIPILSVREIIGVLPITAVPEAPPAMLGVVNLRGKVIPVVDLRQRFGLPSVDPTAASCIIVVDLESGGSSRQCGVLVDRVADVVALSAVDIEPPPEMGEDRPARGLLGMGLIGSRLMVLLDLDEVLAHETVCEALAAA
jgi:purine-binding chemotaxis protein CheW